LTIPSIDGVSLDELEYEYFRMGEMPKLMMEQTDHLREMKNQMVIKKLMEVLMILTLAQVRSGE